LASSSLSSSTCAVYDTYWNLWLSFCADKKFDHGRAKVSHVAEFLSFLHHVKGLGSKTLSVVVSALRTTLSQQGSRIRGETSFPRLLNDVIKSVKMSESRSRRTVPSWDLAIVLDYFRGAVFFPSSSISLKLLSFKTLFLVSLALGLRCAEVHGLSGLGSDVLFNVDGSVTLRFLPDYVSKTDTLDLSQPVVIPSLSSILGPDDEDLALCPVAILRVYLRRTALLRVNQRRLFISFNPKYKRDVRKATLQRWLRTGILSAYAKAGRDCNRANPHELRALSASFALQRNIPLHRVLAAACWRRDTTFLNHYLRDVRGVRQDGAWAISFVAARLPLARPM